jgi:hypothetical protein
MGTLRVVIGDVKMDLILKNGMEAPQSIRNKATI